MGKRRAAEKIAESLDDRHVMNVPVPSPDVATVDQQLEAIAVDIDLTRNMAAYRIGERLKEARDLFRYRRDEGGFRGWAKTRLGWDERKAYRFIEAVDALPIEMSGKFARLSDAAFFEVAKAEPDVQALIAERVEAGEIFTAAKVREIREEAAREASEQSVSQAKEEIAALKKQIKAGDDDADALRSKIKDLSAAIEAHEQAIADYQESLPSPAEAEKQAAAMETGVVLGSDMKFHSGASPEERALAADYMSAWAVLKEFSRDDFPLPGRVATGCAPAFRKQLIGFCAVASTYIDRLREALDAEQD